jgi:hypothetical protein
MLLLCRGVIAHVAASDKARMDVMGTISSIFRIVLVVILCALTASGPGRFAMAAGIIETSPFAVPGVAVDVTAPDATSAKNQALVDAQMKAFVLLAERLGSPELAQEVSRFDTKQVLPYLKSLSIEEELISPGRYQGKLTVRFLPEKIRALYRDYGVKVSVEQGPSFLILPVWTDNGVQVMWGDTPWHRAFQSLNAQQSAIPLFVPLGDAEDRSTISVTDAINDDKVKLEAIRRRYDASVVVVAYGEAAEGGVRGRLFGESPLGRLNFDKVYIAETGTIDDSAALAAQRFHAVMLEKWRSGGYQVSAEDGGGEGGSGNVLSVSVPFAGPSEWNGLRSRILSTPGILSLDVSSLGGDGAVVNLSYLGTLEEMQSSFQATGLQLARVGGVWVVTQTQL